MVGLARQLERVAVEPAHQHRAALPANPRLLVTGGSGFIGSNFVRRVLASRPGWSVVNLDLLTYAASPTSLADLAGDPRYTFIHGDIADPAVVARAMAGVNVVVNFAAESHVDRSILEPGVFVRTNVLGTQVLLDAARAAGVARFLQVSTDEVYGSLGPTGLFTEDTPLDPSSPYSSSKAGADLLVLAYGRTYGLPVNITRCSNNYGPYQFPEKLIPLMISRALADQPLPVYGDGLNIRDWIHVHDHNDAVLAVLEGAPAGRVYNIGGSAERTNLALVSTLLDLLEKPRSLISFVQDRPGHDRRYAIDASRLQAELGWRPRRSFEEGLAETIDWYVHHKGWWTPLLGRSALKVR